MAPTSNNGFSNLKRLSTLLMTPTSIIEQLSSHAYGRRALFSSCVAMYSLIVLGFTKSKLYLHLQNVLEEAMINRTIKVLELISNCCEFSTSTDNERGGRTCLKTPVTKRRSVDQCKKKLWYLHVSNLEEHAFETQPFFLSFF